MEFLPLIGRVLYTLIFLLTGYMHFQSSVIDYAAADGVPYASITVPLFGILSFLGGLSILLGYLPKIGAWLLVIFLIPVTYFMHDFWTQTDAYEYAYQQAMFLKNVGLLGAAFLIAYFGTGPYSLKQE